MAKLGKTLPDTVMRLLAALVNSKNMPEDENGITIEQHVMYKGKKRTYVIAVYEKEEQQ